MKIDKQWLAAFIDGDGWIGKTKSTINGKTYEYPIIKAIQKNNEPLDKICSTFGGRIGKPRIDGVRQWYSRDRDLMREIAPYLTERRRSSLFLDDIPDKADIFSMSWLAGFYEAEGCIITRSNGRDDYLYPTVTITQYYDREPLDICNLIFPSVVSGPNMARGKRIAYAYKVNGSSAIELVESFASNGWISQQKIDQLKLVASKSTLGRERVGSIPRSEHQSIIELHKSGTTYKEISKMYNVTESRIGQIVRGGGL